MSVPSEMIMQLLSTSTSPVASPAIRRFLSSAGVLPLTDAARIPAAQKAPAICSACSIVQQKQMAVPGCSRRR
jgi:hypothetical protein